MILFLEKRKFFLNLHWKNVSFIGVSHWKNVKSFILTDVKM